MKFKRGPLFVSSKSKTLCGSACQGLQLDSYNIAEGRAEYRCAIDMVILVRDERFAYKFLRTDACKMAEDKERAK